MALATVIDPHGNHEENVERIAKHLGRGKVRRAVFGAIYGRNKRSQTSLEIYEKVGKSYPLQSIRNELAKLSNHGLVSKENGTEKSAGEVRYGKIRFVAANKAEIIKYADDANARNKLPTKRRVAGGKSFVARVASIGATGGAIRSSRSVLDVLYLTAAPDPKGHLRTDNEVKAVQQEIQGSRLRDKIRIHPKPAADTNTLLAGLNDLSPQVVHFSGHAGNQFLGMGGGLAFDTLADLLGATDYPPTLLVINACDSLDGADCLLNSVSAVVAMSDSITDAGAIIFAARFYAAIGGGQSIESALKQARAAMKASLLTDADLPSILHRSNVDPARLKLVK